MNKETGGNGVEFLIREENEKKAIQKMEKHWNEEVKPVWDDFFNDEGWIKPFDDYQEGEELELIGKQVNLDEEVKLLNKSPTELWKDFYSWEIGNFIENKTGKTRDLIKELGKINDEFFLSKEDFEKNKIFYPFNNLRNTFSGSYLNLENKIEDLQLEVGCQRDVQGLNYGGVVGLGTDIPNLKDDLSPEDVNGVYLIRALNKEKMFEYWENIVSVHDIINDLSKTLIKKNEISKIEEIYKKREIVFNVLSGEVAKDEVFDTKDEKLNFILDKGIETLGIIKNVKEHELMTREISEDLVNFLEKSDVKKVEEVANLLEVIYKKQNERKESFSKSIPLKLELELSKNELDELKNDEELKSGENKMILIKKLSEIEDQIQKAVEKKDNRKFSERALKKEDDKKLIELNKAKEELKKSLSYDQNGNILTENEIKKMMRVKKIMNEIIPRLEKQKKYFKY